MGPVPETVTRTELLAPGPAQALAGLLDVDPPAVGDELPPMWHWVYLLERPRASDLGPDGHPTRGLPVPPGPGRLRMFAGGAVTTHCALRLGEPATRTTRVERREDKQGRSGPLTFVTVRSDFEQDGRLAITERQDIVYRSPGSRLPARPDATQGPHSTPTASLALDVDAVVLFRFSALTYNAHRIHYDAAYAAREGYPGLVVHGPLQALLMSEVLRRLGAKLVGHELTYRLVAPTFGEQRLTAASYADRGGSRAQVTDAMGTVTATSSLRPVRRRASAEEVSKHPGDPSGHNRRPLSGLSVIDLSQVLAGPLCTMILGDLGADVIKVEPPHGDQSRRSLGTRIGDDSAAFLAVNRNKRSLVLDLSTTSGRAALHRLVATADVVVENFRPGVAERLGAGYDELSELNPRLVYGALTGFGSRGPYAERAGLDLVVQAMTGLMSVTGEEGGRPVKTGPPVADLTSGLYLTIGILAALESRRTSGRGQRVSTSLYESALSLAVWETAELWATGENPGPLGSANRMAAPYQALRTADGYVVVAAINARFWARLCEVLGLPHLVDDPRFSTNADRLQRRPELAALLEDATAGRTTDEWVEDLVAAGVPGGPLLDYPRALADPHTEATGMLVQTEHPVAGTIRMLGSPLHLSDSTFTVRRPPPLLGEHTDEVLADDASHVQSILKCTGDPTRPSAARATKTKEGHHDH